MKLFYYKKLIILVSLNLVYTISIGQIKISGTCYNFESKTPISFATIFLKKANIYTDADQNGYFELNADKDDSIFISCVGYQVYKTSVIDFQLKSEILLFPLPVILPEIFIGKRNQISIGSLSAKKIFRMYSESISRFEMATKIKIPELPKAYQIKQIRIKGVKFNSHNPLRIHLYQVGKYGEPGSELLKKDVIVFDAVTKNDILSINIEEQGIILREREFFIGIQWVSDSLNIRRISSRKSSFIGPGIYCTYSNPNGVTYIRDKANSILGYKWALQTKEIMYPFDYKFPDKIMAPLTILVSCDIEY